MKPTPDAHCPMFRLSFYKIQNSKINPLSRKVFCFVCFFLKKKELKYKTARPRPTAYILINDREISRTVPRQTCRAESRASTRQSI